LPRDAQDARSSQVRESVRSRNPVLMCPHLRGDDNEALFQYLFFLCVPCGFAVSMFSPSLRPLHLCD
jgi:hypothetical protein